MVACGAPLDTALQSLRLQADLDLHRAVGAVRPHPLPVLERSSTSSSFRLSCTDASVASHLRISLCALSAPRWFFVAVEALVVPLRPARVLVLLGILGGLLLPSLGRLAGLDRLVLLLGVTLLGHRYNCGVNDLSAARNVALGLEMLAEAFEQLVDQPGLRQRLAK